MLKALYTILVYRKIGESLLFVIVTMPNSICHNFDLERAVSFPFSLELVRREGKPVLGS